MADVPYRGEEELLAKLEKWLAALGRKPTLTELIESGDADLVAAFTLKAFRRGTREAVLNQLSRAAASFDSHPEEFGNAVMRVFGGLSKAWQLTPAEQAALLGFETPLHLDAAGRTAEAELSIGVIERVAILLNVFEAINTLLPESARADEWMRAPNTHPLFGGRTALQVMISGLKELYEVERYLLAEKWGSPAIEE